MKYIVFKSLLIISLFLIVGCGKVTDAISSSPMDLSMEVTASNGVPARITYTNIFGNTSQYFTSQLLTKWTYTITNAKTGELYSLKVDSYSGYCTITANILGGGITESAVISNPTATNIDMSCIATFVVP